MRRIFPCFQAFKGLRSATQAVALVMALTAVPSLYSAPAENIPLPHSTATQPARDTRGLITDNGWLMFSGGITPWTSFKADTSTVSVPSLQGSGKDFAFEFRFMYPLFKPGIFAVGFCFHVFTLANSANNSPTAVKSTTDITGAQNTVTQPLSASGFATSAVGPALILTARLPLARWFAVSDRTYAYGGLGSGLYYADLTVKAIPGISDKYQNAGYAYVVRTVLGFAVDLGANVGGFVEGQYAPLVYQSTGYVLQGQMASVLAGVEYYFDNRTSR